jgi:hypothetical protein
MIKLETGKRMCIQGGHENGHLRQTSAEVKNHAKIDELIKRCLRERRVVPSRTGGKE